MINLSLTVFALAVAAALGWESGPRIFDFLEEYVGRLIDKRWRKE